MRSINILHTRSSRILRLMAVSAAIVIRFVRNLCQNKRSRSAVRPSYEDWLSGRVFSKEDAAHYRNSVKYLSFSPIITVVVDAKHCDPILLRRCLQSVADQLYPKWICLVLTRATLHSIAAVIREFALSSDRFREVVVDSIGDDSIARIVNTYAESDFFILLGA